MICTKSLPRLPVADPMPKPYEARKYGRGPGLLPQQGDPAPEVQQTREGSRLIGERGCGEDAFWSLWFFWFISFNQRLAALLR